MTTTDRYDAVLERFRPVLDRIAERALEAERTRTLPFEQIGWLKEAGFPALRVPVELGGDGLTWPEYTRFLVELATADSNLVQALRGHVALVEDQLYHHPREDRGRWLERFVAGEIAGNAWTEPGRGGVETLLEEGPDGLTVTGRKYYTTGSIFADWLDVTARRPDGTDVSLVVSAKVPGVAIEDDWDGFGQRLTGTGTAVLDHAPVDPAAVFAFEQRFGYQTALYQHLLLITLAGIGRAAERDVVEQVRTRTRAFGHGNAPLVRHDAQVLQVVGEISARVYVAEAAVHRVADALEAAYRARTGTPEERAAADDRAEIESGTAQVVLTKLVPEAAAAIFDALGASSTRAATLLDRHWRNARTVATHNPAIYKARIAGDRLVNGTPPPKVWTIGVQPGAGAAAGAGVGAEGAAVPV